MDPRNRKLANLLVNHSCKLQNGEKVLIECNGLEPQQLVDAVVQEVYKVGAIPFVKYYSLRTERELSLGATKEQQEILAEVDASLMKQMDAYIGIRAGDNSCQNSDVPSEKQDIKALIYQKKVHFGVRIPDTRWVVLRYPSPSMAQLANSSTSAFEDFYYDVCTLDYSKMSKAMDSLQELMDKTDNVKIKGLGTDLEFSIKGIPTIKCAGELNIPDGEVYTAPVKNSVNGYLTYTAASEYKGFTFENVKLTFKDGKIIESTSNDTERITKIFDTDEGSRYIGEFAIGVNPFITKPMKDTLFDEKIMGSFHFTPGNSYNDAFNSNRSSIHWDLVCIQTPEYGGGEIYFDDVLIRKDGIFTLPELLCLNPENLK